MIYLISIVSALSTKKNVFSFEVLQGSFQEQQSGLNYLTTAAEEVSKKAPVEISQKYRSELEAIVARWKKLTIHLMDQSQKLEELITKVQQFQVGASFAFNYSVPQPPINWGWVGLAFVCRLESEYVGNDSNIMCRKIHTQLWFIISTVL